MIQKDKLNPNCISLLNFAMIPLTKKDAKFNDTGSMTQEDYPDIVMRNIKLYNSDLYRDKFRILRYKDPEVEDVMIWPLKIKRSS